MKDVTKKIEEDFLTKKSEFHSDREVIKEFSSELEAIANRHHLSIDQFLAQAEDSVIDNDDFIKGLALARRIAFLKESEF